MTGTVARAYQAILLIVVGAALGSITLDGRYLNYLKPAMHLPLLLAAVVFVLIGVAELLALRRHNHSTDVIRSVNHSTDVIRSVNHSTDVIRSVNHPTDVIRSVDHPTDVIRSVDYPTDVIRSVDTTDDIPCEEREQHDHHHFPRAGWLLVLPVLAIGFVAPPALGSWAAERDAGTVAQPASSDFPPLPAIDPAPLALGEYGVRAVWDDGRTLSGRTVELIGFVSPRKGGGWFLTRMSLSCCAADALATKVEIRGADAPPTDSWVRVVGRYEPSGSADRSAAVPVLAAQDLQPIDKPQNPYE